MNVLYENKSVYKSQQSAFIIQSMIESWKDLVIEEL